MLYNPKWEVKADPFKLESLVAWLETKPASHVYCWADTGHCLVAQYLREVVGTDNPSGDYYYADVFGHGWPYYEIAAYGEHTFGAALQRARKFVAPDSK